MSHTFHILGYNIDPDAPALAGLCREMKANRNERSLRIIAFLKEKGIEISLSEEVPFPWHIRIRSGSRILNRTLWCGSWQDMA